MKTIDPIKLLKKNRILTYFFSERSTIKRKNLMISIFVIAMTITGMSLTAQTPPPPGFDEANSSAEMEINRFGTVDLTGPTIIQRGEAFINNDGLLEIPLEMMAMCLEGSAPGLGAVRVQAGSNYGLPPTLGTMKQMTPGPSFFPAESSFNIVPKVEIAGMGSFCATDDIILEASGPIIEVPPLGIGYVPPGGIQLPVTFIDCCSGVEVVLFIHVSHTLESENPPIPDLTTTTSIITVDEEALSGGVVGLNLVLPNDCSSIRIASGDVTVSSGQSAAQTAIDLGLALANALALQSACDIDISILNNKITIVQRVLTAYDCCLTGTSIAGDGAILTGITNNLGQEFSKVVGTLTEPDLRCTNLTPSNSIDFEAVDIELIPLGSGVFDIVAKTKIIGHGPFEFFSELELKIDGNPVATAPLSGNIFAGGTCAGHFPPPDCSTKVCPDAEVNGITTAGTCTLSSFGDCVCDYGIAPTVFSSITLPPGGSLSFVADPAGLIDELDETNNDFILPIPIPTLSVWGLIFLSLLLLTIASIAIVRQRQSALVSANGKNINLSTPLFDAGIFRRIALISIPFMFVGIALISIIEGGIYARNILGVIICGMIISFLIQFVIKSDQNSIEK